MKRRRLQGLALVLALLAAPVAGVPAHDAARCCPPEQEAPCHRPVEDCLSRAATTCCAPAPAFPLRPGAFFAQPPLEAPGAAAFDATPVPELPAPASFRHAAELSARASPLLRSVVLRI